MIVVDLETSGIYPEKNGIWQIGSIDLDTMEEFLEEGKIDEEDEITKDALKVTEKTEAELRDNDKQSQKELLEKFFKWIKKRKIKNLICQNPQFDVSFLTIKARKYGLEIPFHYRAIDLHSVGALRYFQINNKFLIKEDHSDMGLKNMLEFCNIPDERIALKDGKIVQEGKSHNALEDCKLEAECFYRLIYGKNLFPEYAKFPVPEVLRK